MVRVLRCAPARRFAEDNAPVLTERPPCHRSTGDADDAGGAGDAGDFGDAGGAGDAGGGSGE